MGRVESRLEKLEAQSGGPRDVIIIRRTIVGPEGVEESHSWRPIFIGDWPEAEREAELARLRRGYPGLSAEGGANG